MVAGGTEGAIEATISGGDVLETSRERALIGGVTGLLFYGGARGIGALPGRSPARTPAAEPNAPVAPSASKGGGGGRRLGPDPNASGPHTALKRDPATGKVTKYETFQPQTNPRNPNPWESTKRFDGSGKGHYNKGTGETVPTPHVHDPTAPGGVRPPEPWEIPQ
jgi:hypothetical protein